MKTKYKIMLLVISILMISTLTIASYAHFTATVLGNNQASNNVITTGNMQLSLNDGVQIGLDGAIPGQSVTKTFKVKNTGTIATTYDIFLSEIFNDFADKNDLMYTITSPTGCSNNTLTRVIPTSTAHNKIVSSCSINPNVEHEYTLTINYIDDNTNQDDNKGKIFSAKIAVNEYTQIAKLIEGNTFNEIIKTLAGTTPNEMGEQIIEQLLLIEETNFSLLNATPNMNITRIEYSNDIPSDLSNAQKVSANDSDLDIYATYDSNAITLHTLGNKIYYNEDSNKTYACLFALSSLNSQIDTTYITDASFFLAGTGFTTLNLNNLNVPNLKNMKAFLLNCPNLQTVSLDFDTPKVTTMRTMFTNSDKLTNITFGSNFTTANVTDMAGMFLQTNALESLDLSNFDTSKVKNMKTMFYSTKSLNSLNLGTNFNTSKVTDMENMFGSTALTTLDLGPKFNTSRVNNMAYMFAGTTNLTNLNLGNDFDTSNVVNMDYMFSESGITTLNLGSKFNTSNLISGIEMFGKMPNITTIYSNDFDLSKLDTSIVSYANNFFPFDYNLVGESGTTYSDERMESKYARVDDPEHGKPGFFTAIP